MALTKDDLKQIDGLLTKRLDDQRDKLVNFIKVELEILRDRMERIEQRLKVVEADVAGLRQEFEEMNERLKQFFKTESEDIEAAYKEIEDIKIRLKKLEHRVGLA